MLEPHNMLGGLDALELRDQLSRELDRLARLDRKREQTRQRIAALRAELAAAGTAQHSDARATPPRSPSEKVALFRSLFRGRPDVFAKRWVNPRKGSAGYAPACSHEWVRDVCEKPRVKCGECPNQAFFSVSDEVILEHLRGRYVVGLYSLLEDETCWFIAADFDKASWKEDVHAFVATCESLAVPVAVERSRSGQGAHVWCFFQAPVAASLARQMACHLITETTVHHDQLSMESYDRLFPSQDTMPRGGFGSLIALPLQHEARQQGNSVFVDSRWAPYADQWEYLASVRRMAPDEVETLARSAAARGRVVGVPLPEVEAKEERAPWLHRPSRHRAPEALPGPLPDTVRAVLAGQLFIEKDKLPSPLLNELKRVAAFQNPEFYKKQAMRLSTVLTPRVISCAEDLPHHVALPRGCADEVRELLRSSGSNLEIQDERTPGNPLQVTFRAELTELQDRALDALASHDSGILVAPPGAGKTVVAAALIARRARSTLVLVHRTQLIEQWSTRLAMFLGVDPKEIGRIGGGRRRPNGRLDVAMIQSLVRRDEVDDLAATYGHIVVDECHHVPAVSFERVLREARARHFTGLTATPHRRDGHHPILHFQLGPACFTLDSRNAAARPLAYRLFVRNTRFIANGPQDIGIQEIYRRLAGDRDRNDLILDDVIAALAAGRSPIVLTERRDHLERLADRLKGFARNLVVLRGGMRTRERGEAMARLANISPEEERVILATGRFVGEGFDDPRLDTLFLTMPLSWKGTLIQYAGRLHRLHPGKSEVRIYDYVDRQVPMLAGMFEKRKRTYAAMGYQPGLAVCTEPPKEHTLDFAEV